MFSFSVQAQNENQLAYYMGKIRSAVRQGLIDPEIGTLSKQGQLLAEHCMRLTPPRSVGQGKRRVAIDIRKIFNPVKLTDIHSPSVREIVRSGDVRAWDKFASNRGAGGFYGLTAVENPSEQLHKVYRDRRGRARRTCFVTLYPQREAIASIIKASQARVGWAKAGWLRGYIELGGTRAPDWVRRHGVIRGQFTDGRNHPENPFVSVGNNSGWGRYKDENQRIVNAAIRARAAAIKTYFEKMMELAARGEIGVMNAWQVQQRAIAEQFFGE